MKQTKLRDYFPMLKTKSEIIDTIKRSNHLTSVFYSWSENARNEFIDFCSGQKGIKILYDSFFKEVFNPEYAPERLNSLLSVIIGTKVKIIQVLPPDSTRMGDETSLVTMDIVVELADKSIVNVEMQKIGYLFPGQRSACYSSDLLLRQYKRVREEIDIHLEPQNFAYNMIKPVYTIVFFENSPAPFQSYPNDYIHFFSQKSNTGLSIELLQKYIFIPLDIFKSISHNIDSELCAWLTFLSSDDPKDILSLIEKYPEFKPLYDTLFSLCQNIDGVMQMFSKELYELDKNTEKLMVDEFRRQVKELEALVAEKQSVLAEKDSVIAEKDSVIAEKDSALAEKDSALAEKDSVIAELKQKLKAFEAG